MRAFAAILRKYNARTRDGRSSVSGKPTLLCSPFPWHLTVVWRPYGDNAGCGIEQEENKLKVGGLGEASMTEKKADWVNSVYLGDAGSKSDTKSEYLSAWLPSLWPWLAYI